MNTRRAALALMLLAALSGVPKACRSVPPPLISADRIRLDRIHDGGVRGNASVIPDIRAVLNYPSVIPRAVAGDRYDPFTQISPVLVEVCLRAAIRLHAVSVLLEIDRLIASADPEASALARVAKARLLADGAARTVPGPRRRAAKRIAAFYAQLGLTPADLNAALSAYNRPELDANGRPVLRTDWVKPTPLGVHALREIADIVYQDGAQDYLRLPAVMGLDFKDDSSSVIKLRFARPTRAERAAALVEYLAHWQPGMPDEGPTGYVTRLAVDEGPAAARAAVDKIRVIEKHPERYTKYGIYNLADVIRRVADRARGARLATVHDPCPQVEADFREAAESVSRGNSR